MWMSRFPQVRAFMHKMEGLSVNQLSDSLGAAL